MLGLVATITALVCVAGILFAAEPAVTFNPTKPLLAQDYRPIQVILPQGFAFFTRDAREKDLYLYREEDRGWTSAMMGPNSRPANLFGLNRKSRAQNVESALILSKIKPNIWWDCDEEPSSCLEQDIVRDTVRNVVPQPTLCGPHGFALQEPVPWAWSKSRDSITMKSQITKIHIQC